MVSIRREQGQSLTAAEADKTNSVVGKIKNGGNAETKKSKEVIKEQPTKSQRLASIPDV